ncbi:MAG: AEC family transporter [Pseudomonadota bacterium]
MIDSLTSPAWLLILLMVGLGKVLRAAGTFPENAPDTLNRYVIDIALPALVLVNVRDLSLDPALLWLFATPWLTLLCSVIVVLGLARLAGWSRGMTGALLMLVPLGNTAYLGYPLIEAMIGPDAVRYGVIYDQFGTFLILSSYGLVVAAMMGDGEQPTARSIGLKILRFPPFIMLLVALAPITWPEWVIEVARMISATLVPTACLAVGLQLRLRLPRHLLVPFTTGLALKLVGLPLAAVGILTAAGVEGTLLRVGVLESGMPPMITAGALASAAGLEPELCAALVGVGIFASFFTIPAVLALT